MRLIARAEEFRDDREPPLRMGDLCYLNSGSPPLMVVDVAEPLTVAWRDGGTVQELSLPAACVHRAGNIW